ncbi:MAG: endonuclease III [Phycisphaerae bacterium]
MLRRLEKAYERPVWKCWGDAVSVLVDTILSQNTNNANSGAGYRQLRRRFRTWAAVADAPTAEVARCIRISGLSNIKAPRIQSILRQVRRARGKIDLQFLGDMPPAKAYEYLMRSKGVGPKTANCVLLFSLGMPVFPVDTHIHRIAKRLGLIPARATAEKCQDVLTPLIAPADRYAMHILLIRLGRDICRARNPQCEWCCLDDICPYGVRRQSREAGPVDPRDALTAHAETTRISASSPEFC